MQRWAGKQAQSAGKTEMDGRTEGQTDRGTASQPHLNDYQQQLSRMQPEDQPQPRQNIREPPPVMLASGSPVVPGSACAEESSQVQEQQLRHQKHCQPC